MRKSFSLVFFFFPLYFLGTKHNLNVFIFFKWGAWVLPCTKTYDFRESIFHYFMEAWCRPPFWGFILSHFSVGYFLPDGGFSESHVLQPNGLSENHVSGSKAAIGVRHLEEYSERGVLFAARSLVQERKWAYSSRRWWCFCWGVFGERYFRGS